MHDLVTISVLLKQEGIVQSSQLEAVVVVADVVGALVTAVVAVVVAVGALVTALVAVVAMKRL